MVPADLPPRSVGDSPRGAEPRPGGFGCADLVALVVGIVVGTAIFKSPPLVFQNSGGPGRALANWALGGTLSLCGALCYAELASSMPDNGGDYRYLSRAFGPLAGFLFGWAQVTAVLSASIAAMAYAFGDYAVRALDRPPSAALAWGVVAILAATLLNVAGAEAGKRTQNALSLLKVGGLASIVAAGVVAAAAAPPAAEPPIPEAAATADPSWGLAMVFVLYAFGGWNDAAFVAAEVRDPQRTVPRALLLGLGAVTLLYLAVNAAVWGALGWEGACRSRVPAADVMRTALGPLGERAVSALVAASALGAMHGMLLAGARVNAQLGADYAFCGWLAARGRQTQTPLGGVAALAAAALLLMLGVGTPAGQRLIDAGLQCGGAAPVPWERYFGGFETLVASTAPVFWAFFLLTGVALPVLRFREPDRPRPFRVPWYPWPVVVFCGASAAMLYASLEYAGWLAALGALPLAAGAVVYAASRRAAAWRRQ